MSNKRPYAITLKKEIHIPKTDSWTGGRGDVITCRDYDMDPNEITLIDTDKGHNIIIVSRDNVVGIVH